jgi:hypothetical protein
LEPVSKLLASVFQKKKEKVKVQQGSGDGGAGGEENEIV